MSRAPGPLFPCLLHLENFGKHVSEIAEHGIDLGHIDLMEFPERLGEFFIFVAWRCPPVAR